MSRKNNKINYIEKNIRDITNKDALTKRNRKT